MSEDVGIRGVVDFFREFGLFDIVFPFLLIFSIMFAILEKTRILGTEEIKLKGETIQQPKRSLNAMVSFVIAMIVVSTDYIISAINRALPSVVLMIVIGISLLLMIGVFYKSGEFGLDAKHKKTTTALVIVMVVATILIFLNSFNYDEDTTVLEYIVNYAVTHYEGTVVTSFIFLIVVLLAIGFIVKGPALLKEKEGGG